MLATPKDFVGSILGLAIGRAMERRDFSESVKKWKMVVALETDYYAMTLTFRSGVYANMGNTSEATLRIGIGLAELVDIARGETTMMWAFLTHRIRIKGVLRHPLAALRFYRLMSAALGA